MTVPSFVRRTALRILVGGMAAMALVAALGFAVERARFGADAQAARARIEVEVHLLFWNLAERLDVAVRALATDPAPIPTGQAYDTPAVRLLFDRVAEAGARAALDGLALTVADPAGQPIAWSGRPGDVPPERLSGPSTLFLAPSPMGLRLVRVDPLTETGDTSRRVGVVVAETPLPPADESGANDRGFVIDTSVVPVPLRPGYLGTPPPTPSAVLIWAPSGELLAAIDVPDEALDRARQDFRSRVAGAVLLVACLTVLLLTGPLADWRRLVPRPARHVLLTAAIIGLLVIARRIAWSAVEWAGLALPPLAPQTETSRATWLLLASPFDFLITALWLAGIVATLAGAYEQWRHSRWLPVQVVVAGQRAHLATFIAAQLLAGVAAGALIVTYETFLSAELSQALIDIVHFALHQWDVSRMAIAAGLIVLHAVVLAAAVLVLRVGAAPWIVPVHRRGWRLLVPLLWLAGGLAVALLVRPMGERVAFVPASLAMAFVVAAAWTLGRYRAAFRHASQAWRLLAMFLVVVLPSIVFYPSLVDAEARSRRQLIETRYATEVINQRRDLQLHLNETLRQIDTYLGLGGLIQAADAVPVGPPPTEAAFFVWSQTVLADQRLTSSVELFDARGDIVSRFALKLPDTMNSPDQATGCAWDFFEEVSPFFSEERKLFHAGRSVCIEEPGQRPRVVGSITVHVMLDYRNLSFASVQSPYLALLRSPDAQTTESTARDVEFVVYGWGRRPLFMSGRDAWPLTEAIFSRALASREPFWAEVRRDNTAYDVYYLNDRAGIYALGYPRTSAFGHLVTLAEIITLAGVTFAFLLLCGLVYGRVTARTPASGRALLREVRASFYRKLFLAFVLAAVVPVLALAFVTRAYVTALMLSDIRMEAVRTAASASRVVEDFAVFQARGGSTAPVVDDSLVEWLSRVIAQDVNIYDGADLLASSERNLFASGLLPTRTAGDIYRAIMLDARPSHVAREGVGGYEYLVAAAPVRIQTREVILTVPLTLRQREIEAQIDELDRRVLLAALGFILIGAIIGYSMAERIADPVNRLTRATQRIARGDLDARIIATSSDEFRRLVEAFNKMAADLQRQRAELERTNRLAAWADMARQVAHDIKNPLTPIQLNAEHLRRVHIDRGSPLGQVLDDGVANILTQVRLLRQIASEFSSFASSPSPRPAPTSVAAVVHEVVEPYRAGLAGRVDIDVRVGDAVPPAFVDRVLLARALTNIIENALHAMPGGGTLRIDVSPDGPKTVRLAVTDTGVGMSPDALKRIFEPYFSTKATGTGLGLTIAKRNVELNGGAIAVASEPGVGTTVTMRVPSLENAETLAGAIGRA